MCPLRRGRRPVRRPRWAGRSPRGNPGRGARRRAGRRSGPGPFSARPIAGVERTQGIVPAALAAELDGRLDLDQQLGQRFAPSGQFEQAGHDRRDPVPAPSPELGLVEPPEGDTLGLAVTAEAGQLRGVLEGSDGRRLRAAEGQDRPQQRRLDFEVGAGRKAIGQESQIAQWCPGERLHHGGSDGAPLTIEILGRGRHGKGLAEVTALEQVRGTPPEHVALHRGVTPKAQSGQPEGVQPEGAVGPTIGERQVTEQVLGRQVRVGDRSKQVVVDGLEQGQPADGLEPVGIDLVEHLLPQVLGGGLTAGDGDQLGERRPADRGQQVRGHAASAANRPSSSSSKASSASPSSTTSSLSRRRATGSGGSWRPAISRCPLRGRAARRSAIACSPGEAGVMAWTSSSTTATSSGALDHRASITASTVGSAWRPRAVNSPAASSAASASSGRHCSQTSTPLGCSSFSARALVSSAVLPKPGPATTVVRRRSNRPARVASRRGRGT